MTDIFFWTRHDEHGYCSNFYRSPITVTIPYNEIGNTWHLLRGGPGDIYPTVEHFYQAQKSPFLREHNMIRALETPKEAKFAGYHVTLRAGWEEIREEIMLIGLRAKFTQHLDLQEKLLSTRDAALHENSPWDMYWGYVSSKGQDRLGKLLMQVRVELQETE